MHRKWERRALASGTNSYRVPAPHLPPFSLSLYPATPRPLRPAALVSLSFRLILAEANEINLVMIGNFKAHTDLLTLMKKQSVQEATVSRIEWEKREAAWRHLRHDDSIARFHNELDSTRFTNPQNRREVRTCTYR